MKNLAIASLTAMVLLAACNRQEARDDTRFDVLETEDVDAAVDAGLTTDDDERAKARGPEVAGVLPEGFPADAPLFTPSSVVDFGAVGGGRYFVDFDTMAPLEEVRRVLISRLSSGGWVESADGSYTKSGHRIRLGFKNMAPGTRIHYEFGL